MAKLSNGCLLLLCVAVTASPALAGRSRWDRELFAQLQLQQRVREPAIPEPGAVGLFALGAAAVAAAVKRSRRA